MATLGENRRILAARIVDELVDTFAASGVPYSCVAVVLAVIEAPAYAAVRQSGDPKLRPRALINRALDAIHAAKYP